MGDIVVVILIVALVLMVFRGVGANTGRRGE